MACSRTIRTASLIPVLVLLACGSSEKTDGTPLPDGVAATAEQTKPLTAGAGAPEVTFQDIDGKPVAMKQLLSAGPVALIYYRGGWCPYCNAHLGELKTIEGTLENLGYQVIGVSPDRAAKLRESKEKIEPGFRLLSDSAMDGARAFGIAFRVDDSYNTKLRMFGIDIEDASGKKHHLLPVPSVFLIAPDGKIQYVHSDPNYKARLDNDALLAAAQQHKP